VILEKRKDVDKIINTEQQKLLVVNTYMIMKKRLWITLLKGCVL